MLLHVGVSTKMMRAAAEPAVHEGGDNTHGLYITISALHGLKTFPGVAQQSCGI